MTDASKQPGPTAYEALLKLATERTGGGIHTVLYRHINRALNDLEPLVNEVYLQGLRDGFQQGVQAAVDMAEAVDSGQQGETP